MKLWAISDLHVGYEENRRAVQALPDYPEDWLIIAGDTGETPAHLDFVLRTLTPRFAQVIWTPGNHDLWTPRTLPTAQRGVPHYQRLVSLCHKYRALTPEDGFARWPGDGPARAIVPTFTLFDYSFRPATVTRENAVTWASITGVRSADEDLLSPNPYATCDEWCAARVAYTEQRLAEMSPDTRLIVANHFPLRAELAVLPRIPRFSIWCGTTRTSDWHRRFNIETAIYGHLHMRSSRHIDGVRFEEVSLGYPRQWQQSTPLAGYLRQIL
ncbi:MAG TPA: metallophosphoesterase [Vicinamibacterales bacterium]|nr:metallophosphoesterase [Vicinamibacterales bacterium]